MIPRKVQEQADRAEQLMQQQLGNTGEPASPEPAPVANVEQPPVDAQAQQPETPQPDPWEHKYKVLANKYSAEVPRYAEELRDLKRELQSAKEELERVKTTPVVEDKPKLTPAQVVEQFGEDFAGAVGAIAAQIAEQKAARLRDEFRPKVEAIESTAVKSARANFMSELAGLVPNWAEIDRDDGFTAFLDEVDPLTGRARREFFSEADAGNDARRVAEFFRTYSGKSSVAATPSAAALVTPPAARAQSLPPSKKIWTQAEIRNFYSAAKRGDFSAEKYRQIESEIDAAVATGRIAA